MENVSQSKILYQIIKDDKEKLKNDMNEIIQTNMDSFISMLKDSVHLSIDKKISDFYGSNFEYNDVLYDTFCTINIENTLKKSISQLINNINECKRGNPSIATIQHIKNKEKQIEKIKMIIEKKEKCFFFTRMNPHPTCQNNVTRTRYTYIFFPSGILQNTVHLQNEILNAPCSFFENNFSKNILFTIKYLSQFFFTEDTSDCDFRKFYTEYEKNPSYFENGGDFEMICKQQKMTYDTELVQLREKNDDIEKLKKKFIDKHEYYNELKNKYEEFENEKKYFMLIKKKIDMTKNDLDNEKKIFEKEKIIFEKEKIIFEKEKYKFDLLKSSTIDINSYFNEK
jgi:hypothetical protein